MKAFYENRKYHANIPITVIRSRNLNFLAHWHRDVEIIYVLDGRIGTSINQERQILTKGDLAICGSSDIHYYDSAVGSSEVLIIIFRPEFLKDDYVNGCTNLKSLFLTDMELSLKEKFKHLFNNLYMETQIKDESYPLFLKCRVLELLANIVREFPEYALNLKGSRTYNPGEMAPMQEALQYLEENYYKSITLDKLSKKVNLSKFYLSRLFKRTTGMNIVEYLNHIRTDRAEKMIKQTRKPIIEIALENGFRSIRTFNRVFRDIKGYAPSSLR